MKPKFRSTYLLLLGLLASTFGYCQSASLTDSLWQAIQSTDNDSAKAKLLIDLSWETLFSDPDSAHFLAQEVQRVARRIPHKRFEMQGLSNSGISWSIRSNNDASLHDFETGLEMAVTEKDTVMIGLFLNNMGNVYMDMGNYPRALDIYLRSLGLKQGMNDSLGIATALNNIGSVYEEMGDRSESKPYYERALELELKLGREEGIARIYANLAVINESEKKAEVAENYYLASLAGYTKLENTYGIAQAYQGLGNVYLIQEEYAEAEKALLQALDLFEEMEGEFAVGSVKIDLADLYLLQGKLKQAETLAIEGLANAKAVEAPVKESEAHETLSNIFEAESQYKQSLFHHRQYVLLRDSTQNEERLKALTQLAMRHEFEQEQEADKLEKAAEKRVLEEAERKRNLRQYLYIFGGFVGLMLVLLFLTRRLKAVRTRFFIAFLAIMTFYQFLLVVLDPLIFKLTGGVPIPQFLSSVVLALVFAKLMQWVRRWLRKREEEKE